MVEIESYLRDRDGRFTPIAKVRDAPAEPRHVEGALTLTIDGVAVIDTSLWDDVDQLWAYISDMVSSLNEKDEVSTYFPDRAIELVFRRQPHGRILVSLPWPGDPDRSKAVTADERELIGQLQAKGSAFFAKMSELLPDRRSIYDKSVARFMSYQGR
jgi:hypothetical protein